MQDVSQLYCLLEPVCATHPPAAFPPYLTKSQTAVTAFSCATTFESTTIALTRSGLRMYGLKMGSVS